MRFTRSFVGGIAGAVLLGAVGVSTTLGSAASASLRPATLSSMDNPTGMMSRLQTDDMLMVGPTGNIVEMVAPDDSTYIPDIAAASAEDVAKAQRLLDGANDFCRTHTVAWLQANWRPGMNNPANPSHYFNPDPNSRGLDPSNPRAALVYDGQLGGIMMTGEPLPYLGTIPRAHSHTTMTMGGHMGVEMVHVYCTPGLKEAFTPNRMLGVKAAMIELRLMIRPAIMDLNRSQLHEVRALVRGYLGDRLQQVAPDWTNGGAHPVLTAMRTEIRNSLMLLTETQLRNVWSLMQSY